MVFAEGGAGVPGAGEDAPGDRGPLGVCDKWVVLGDCEGGWGEGRRGGEEERGVINLPE